MAVLYFLIICILNFILQDVNCDPLDDIEVQVKTLNGDIRGRVTNVPGIEKKVAKFLGIPYAEPPVGDLRFKNPIPKTHWNETLHAVNYQSPCMQVKDTVFEGFESAEMWNPTIPVNEDCLYLNIFVPYPLKQNSSVMFWIFGGSYYCGTSSLWIYDGQTLAGFGDVIVVTFDYRLNLFGFLSSGDDRIKGNFGMEDQVLALKWVHDNIERFGGNPNSITLFGESSGASSVGFHLLSPLSQNLFHKAILQSGSHNSRFSYHKRPLVKLHFQDLLSHFKCKDDNEVLSCLQKISADEINSYSVNAWQKVDIFANPFAPVIDEEFLVETPHFQNNANLKPMPILLSTTKNEASYYFLYYFPKHFSKDNDSCVTADTYSAIIDKMYKDLSQHDLAMVKFLYTDWTDAHSPIKNRDALDELAGDRDFKCPIHEFAEQIIEYNSDVYLTEFSYRASNERWPNWMGVYHSHELLFLFGHPFNESRGFSDKDRNVSKHLMKWWTNFAKSGNPNDDITVSEGIPTWPALHSGHEYLLIGQDEMEIHKHWRDRECAFWNFLLPKLAHLSC